MGENRIAEKRGAQTNPQTNLVQSAGIAGGLNQVRLCTNSGGLNQVRLCAYFSPISSFTIASMSMIDGTLGSLLFRVTLSNSRFCAACWAR